MKIRISCRFEGTFHRLASFQIKQDWKKRETTFFLKSVDQCKYSTQIFKWKVSLQKSELNWNRPNKNTHSFKMSFSIIHWNKEKNTDKGSIMREGNMKKVILKQGSSTSKWVVLLRLCFLYMFFIIETDSILEPSRSVKWCCLKKKNALLTA